MASAHSPNSHAQWHGLAEHLSGTAERAAAFASAWGASDLAALLGRLHDIGKCHPDWQRYLHTSTADPTLRGTGPEHKLAGALLATRTGLGPFALAILGHHGGLPSLADAKARLAPISDPVRHEAAELAIRIASDQFPQLDTVMPRDLIPEEIATGNSRSQEHYLRMVFSALVDADFLDTEAHFDQGRAHLRASSEATPGALLERLLDDQRAAFGRLTGTVADARHAIFEACLTAAEQPPGLYRLTVPTGGGKTRAALAFALRHAARHNQRRVIVAVPFVSITEQTADVYRGIFASFGPGTVLEHHSAVEDIADDHTEDGTAWSRLAAENWDAPIVVTTTVQLLESLFAHRPSRTRKLHRIARSVIVLDEVQSLPPRLLDPTLDMLQELTRSYGVTVVLSTATQPAFEVLPVFADAGATEIVPDPGRWYGALRRVEYELRATPPPSWDEVAKWLRGEHQALAIVNTRADAVTLLRALDDPAALHLSTLLCGAHRRAAIEDIRRRLASRERCVVVSTQVVEAGVDLDFPAVYRAVAPLDAIVQAAGRCNREGRLPSGRVVIFDPAEAGLPPGAYGTATVQARRFLDSGEVDLDRLETLRGYYTALLPLLETDAGTVQQRRAVLDYPEVAHRYRLIDEDSESVAITTYGTPEQRRQVEALLDDARGARGNARWVLRDLQPYLVSIPRYTADRLRARGLVELVTPGLGVWLGDYDAVAGLVMDGESPLRVM